MNHHKHNGTKGERPEADARGILEARRAVYIRRGRRALLRALLCIEAASADEVRDLVELPTDIAPECFGAVPGELVRAGIIRFGGYERTCRPAAHGRPVTRWVLADRVKALRWLAEHPDPLDAGDDARGGTGSQGLSFFVNSNDPTSTVGTAGAGLEV